jgi:Mg-chelatase subunit ChlD
MARTAISQVGDDGSASSAPPGLLMRLVRLLSPTAPSTRAETNVDAASVRGLMVLIGVLRGEFERHLHVTRTAHRDGVPRGWRRMQSLEAFAEDAEPVDACRWLETHGMLPDAVRRAKPNRGGALAICRDVSTSMHGINARYASSLALRVLELAQRRRMRVAMLEYSDGVHAHRLASASNGSSNGFFSTEYGSLRDFARRLECGGLTDYEAPIRKTLDEFAADRRLRSPYVPKHILFITDGHPTKGDRRCVEARRRMRRSGVQLHTLFVEPDPGAEYPPLLAALADDSMGVRMRASVVDAAAGVIEVSVSSPTYEATSRFAGRRLDIERDLGGLGGLGQYPRLASLYNFGK